jgi:hypothetical protein
MSLGGSHARASREITKHHRPIGFREHPEELTSNLYGPNTSLFCRHDSSSKVIIANQLGHTQLFFYNKSID